MIAKIKIVTDDLHESQELIDLIKELNIKEGSEFTYSLIENGLEVTTQKNGARFFSLGVAYGGLLSSKNITKIIDKGEKYRMIKKRLRESKT